MKNIGLVTKENDGYQVVLDRILNHSIEQVWNAITDPEQLRYWFTDIEMDFRPGGKITIQFRDKARTTSHGEIVSIDPPNKFVWTWEGELAVWELKRVNANTTRLILTYSKLPSDYAVSAPSGFHCLIDRLEQRLNGSDAVHAFGDDNNDPEVVRIKVHYAAAVFRTLPDVIKHKPVIVEKTCSATVERVWRALTEREQMEQWYFHLDDFQAEPGFHFSFPGQGHKGEKYIHHCTVTEVIPMQRLQFSWAYEGYDGYSLVTFELTSVGNKTKLTVTHHGLETFPQGTPDFAWGSFNEGWNHIVGISLPEFLGKE